MSESNMILARIEGSSPEEREEMAKYFRNAFPKYDVVVSDDSTEIYKMPLVEDLVDEIVNRMKDEDQDSDRPL